MNEKWITIFKFIIHSEIANSDYLIYYVVHQFKDLYNFS